MTSSAIHDSGWIKIHRVLLNSQLWLSEPFSRGQAWIDLVLLANYRKGFIRIGGERIDLERGQCGWSKLRLAERWRWSRGRVDRFLMDLERDNRVIIKQNNRTSIITICNYGKYQAEELSSETPDRTTDRAPDETPDRTTDRTLKKKNKENSSMRARESAASALAPDTLPLTLAAARKHFPSVNGVFLTKLSQTVTSAGVAELTDARLAEAVSETFLPTQRTPNLWFHRVPEYLLRDGAEPDDFDPMERNREVLAEEARAEQEWHARVEEATRGQA